ncbi:MAG TPA: hypothetical protein VGG75_31550 [Trebonia sp.]
MAPLSPTLSAPAGAEAPGWTGQPASAGPLAGLAVRARPLVSGRSWTTARPPEPPGARGKAS